MDEANKIPASVNLGQWTCQGYYVTAALWRNEYGDSYEIGIRNRTTDKFDLMQSRHWRSDTVVVAGKAIALLLDNGFTPSQLGDIFE